MTSNTYNGWANYQTWNAALWIGNDEFLYNTAKACVEYCGNDETPWQKFVRCMTDGQIGRMLGQTADGVKWNDPRNRCGRDAGDDGRPLRGCPPIRATINPYQTTPNPDDPQGYPLLPQEQNHSHGSVCPLP